MAKKVTAKAAEPGPLDGPAVAPINIEDIELEQGDEPQAELTHFAYDIFLGEDNRSYVIATIKYNPTTKDALVVETKPIERNIGLSHDHQKRALTTLKSR